MYSAVPCMRVHGERGCTCTVQMRPRQNVMVQLDSTRLLDALKSCISIQLRAIVRTLTGNKWTRLVVCQVVAAGQPAGNIDGVPAVVRSIPVAARAKLQ